MTSPFARISILFRLLLVGSALVLNSIAWAGFNDVTSQVQLVAQKKKSWGNPIWGDINGDGFLDLIVPTHGLLKSHGPFVYLNNGGNSFIDIRTTCGIGASDTLDSLDWHGFAFGDYDNDGKLDLYVSEGALGNQGGTTKRDLLFRGNGDGTFQYVSDRTGIETNMYRGRTGSWFDYDNDGQLDLFVKNFDAANVLYHNNGDGTLTAVSAAGDLLESTDGVDHGSIVAFADYDNDGFTDLAITGDGNAQALYHNNGNGTFTDVTVASGMVTQANGKGLAWGDYNNDGFMDLFVARGHPGTQGSGTSLYRNNGDGTFTDVTEGAGIALNGSCWSGVWGDYDNDGHLDLFVTNTGALGNGVGNANFLFHNNRDGTFTNVAATEGVAMEDGVSLHKGAAWADYDNDGFLDLLIKDGVGTEKENGTGAEGYHFLLRNLGNRNRFVKIKLVGVESNLAGIGAKIAVKTQNFTCWRQQYGGGGGEYDSQSSQPIHVGIGSGKRVNVTIKWPSGTVDYLPGVLGNRTVTIREGSTSKVAR